VIGGDDIARIALKQARKVDANMIVMGATEEMAFSKSTLQILKESQIPVLYIPRSPSSAAE
jgi:nucleotide-binding universal stress UspA family protein